MQQIDLFSYMSQEPAEVHEAAERDLNEPNIASTQQNDASAQHDRCNGCRHDRPMTAWGETFQACHYRRDTGDERGLYTTEDDGCSGYDDGLKRGPAGRILNGMYYERSTGLFVSFVHGRRHWEGDCRGYDAAWQRRIRTERAIE